MTVGAGVLPTFVGPDEVRARQLAVSTDLANVRAALQRCATSGTFTPDKTPGDWGAWQAFRQRGEAFVVETPSWFTAKAQCDRGDALLRELATWHDRARALGCDAGPAAPAPPAGVLDQWAGSLSAGLAPALLVLLALYLWKR